MLMSNNYSKESVSVSWTETEKIIADLVRAKGAPIGYATTMARVLRWSEALWPGTLARTVMKETAVMEKIPVVFEKVEAQLGQSKKIEADFCNKSWYEHGPGFFDWLQGEALLHGHCLGAAHNIRSIDGIFYSICVQLSVELCGKIDLFIDCSHAIDCEEKSAGEKDKDYIGTLWFNQIPEEAQEHTKEILEPMAFIEENLLCFDDIARINRCHSITARCSLEATGLSDKSPEYRSKIKSGKIAFRASSGQIVFVEKNEKIRNTISAAKRVGIPMTLYTYTLLREQAHKFLIDSSVKSKAQAG